MPGDEIMTAARYRALQGLSIPPKGEAEPRAKREQPERELPDYVRCPDCSTCSGTGRVPHPDLWLTLPYPPSSNANWRNVGGKTILSAKAREYKKAVAAITAGMDPMLGPVRLTLRVFRPRKSGDLMNREKLISDCLQGAAFKNDSQIHEAHLYLGDDKNNPRVEVLVEALDTSGTTK